MQGATPEKYTDLQLPNGIRLPLKTYLKANNSHQAEDGRIFRKDTITSQSPGSRFDVPLKGKVHRPEPGYWKTDEARFTRLVRTDRVETTSKQLAYVRFHDDFSVFPINNVWTDLGGVQSRSDPKIYVVQTATSAVERCMLMTTDPGDLVLDPTCGSGTTAYVAEEWGRRWITVDTSRVALALARARIMGARYPYYLLADSEEGHVKEAEVSGNPRSMAKSTGNVKFGFVNRRVPHVTLKSIANNAEIDEIWERHLPTVEAALTELGRVRQRTFQEWEVLPEPADPWPSAAQKLHAKALAEKEAGNARKLAKHIFDLNTQLKRSYTPDTLPAIAAEPWPADQVSAHTTFWDARRARQAEMDASISKRAEMEYLYDQPYDDPKRVRVAGPFTVESLSPHRTLTVDADGDPIQPSEDSDATSFAEMMLRQLRKAGVQQSEQSARITFDGIEAWQGKYVHAVGTYQDAEGSLQKAAITIGPEFGTVQRLDIVRAAREGVDAGFKLLIVCGFNFDAMSTEVSSMGSLQILKARMNTDLHMKDLADSGKGNLFVVFGEPDVCIEPTEDGQYVVSVKGVDVFDPAKNEIRSDDVEGIASWMVDTNYNSESFFVRHAYFLGANDPYNSLKSALGADVDPTAWASLNSAESRPFDLPETGQIAVKVINHLGDEVMRVFDIPPA